MLIFNQLLLTSAGKAISKARNDSNTNGSQGLTVQPIRFGIYLFHQSGSPISPQRTNNQDNDHQNEAEGHCQFGDDVKPKSRGETQDDRP